MEIVSVREFKASFHRLLQDGKEILITSRGRPVGLFKPLKPQDLKQIKRALGRQLVGLGEGPRGPISEHHDEVLYE